MIRNLLIITIVGFLGAVVCLAGAAAVGGPIWGKRSWSHDVSTKCSWSPNGRKRTCTSVTVDGRAKHGDMAARDFTWTGSDTLVVNLPAKVHYTQGPAAKVTVTAPKAVLDRLKMENGEIGVTGERFNFHDSDIDIVIQAPAVKVFRLNGGQKVEIDGYAQESLAIEANGAVDLDASGSARTLDLRINGAGEADLDDLALDEAKVEMNGAGKASLAPKRSVDIRINGVGHVELGARPQVMNKEIHGIGSVTILEPDQADEDDSDGSSPAKRLGVDT